jgi:capsule polysaccharide export protein KpsE/RkpR
VAASVVSEVHLCRGAGRVSCAGADDLVAKLQDAITQVEADLDQARAAGDQKRIAALEDDLASRRAFLETAQRASADFS